MAIVNQILHRKNSSGTYDTIYLESSANVIMRADGTHTVEQSLSAIEGWSILKYEESSGTIIPPFVDYKDAKTLQGHPASYFATASDIPSIPTPTSADNNKVLGVSNGIYSLLSGGNASLKGTIITLTVSNWEMDSNINCYKQSVTILDKGLNINSNVICDCALSLSDLDADIEMLNAWGNVNNAVAGNNILTFYCYNNIPTVNISVSVVIG